MQNTGVKKKLSKVNVPVSFEVGAVLSYLRVNGVVDELIERILAIWHASLGRCEKLYEQVEKAYTLRNDLIAQLPNSARDPKFFDKLTDTVRHIVSLHREIDLEEQLLWISVAKESGCPEVAGGFRWIPRKSVINAAYDSSVESGAVEYNNQLLTRMASILKELRKGRGMTLEQVATASASIYPMMKEAHITAPHLHRAENAKTFLSPLKLMALSQVYGLPFDVFLARLELKGFSDSLRDLARHLVLGIFGDVSSALHDSKIGMAEELVRLRGSFATLDAQYKTVSLEGDSLKRQVEFLEGELKSLRKGLANLHI